jgi:hypothetical protein
MLADQAIKMSGAGNVDCARSDAAASGATAMPCGERQQLQMFVTLVGAGARKMSVPQAGAPSAGRHFA